MIAAVLVAALLGVLATYSLVGRPNRSGAIVTGFLMGLPLVAVSGAGLGVITLPWAVGMAVAVGVGLTLSGRIPLVGPFAAAVSMTAGLVLTAGLLRWLVPVAADLANLDPRVLALGVLAAAAVWAVGDRATWLRTAFVLCLVTAGLLLVAGLVVGAPGTLTAPLLSSDLDALTGVAWLVLVVLVGAAHPGGRRTPMSGVMAGVALLAGLLGVLSLGAGFLEFPSSGLLTVVGYASIGTGAPGLLLALVPVTVAAVAGGLTMREVLRPWQGYEAPIPALGSPGVRIAVVATLVGLLTFAPASTAVLVGVTGIGALVAVLVGRRAAGPGDPVGAQGRRGEAVGEPGAVLESPGSS